MGRIDLYHRKKAGLTQQELARLAGMGKTVVFDIEKGKKSVRLDSLMKILSALNVSLKLESPLMRLYEKEESNEES
ncbi:MAG: helix-turn-helix domain-containing protein [Fidelibacterota bacterium]